MPLVPQVLQTIKNIRQVVKEIAEYHDDAAARDEFGEVMEDWRQAGAFAARPFVEASDHLLEVRRLANRLEQLPHLIVVGDESGSVLLMQDQIGQSRCTHAGIIILADE